MKKKMVIFGLLLVMIVGISGCGSKDGSEVTGEAVASVCNSPYFEYKAGECCLDKNSNSICDSDEAIVEEVKEETTTPTPTETTTTTEEVEITLNDACSDTSYFECKASYITKDEVFFKFETRKDGYTHLEKLSVNGCEKEFAIKEKSSQGYQIRSNIVVSIPCTKNTAGNELSDVDYVLNYKFYPVSSIDAASGEYEGVERFMQSSTGKISGTVRNEPKKII